VPKDLSKEILEACTPMIEWLRSAEYESGDEEDDETNQMSMGNEMSMNTISTGHKFNLIQGDEDDIIDIDDL